MSASRTRGPGSLWEQVLVFPADTRYFVSMDRVTSVNAVDELALRIDLTGHLKHDRGDTFEQICRSYEGCLVERRLPGGLSARRAPFPPAGHPRP